jgi:hypothetical protein
MTMTIGFDTLIDTHKAVGAISNTRSTPVFQLGRNVELSFGQPPETKNDFFNKKIERKRKMEKNFRKRFWERNFENSKIPELLLFWGRGEWMN